MKEGPAAGLGRQHTMSRVATGWIPNRSLVGTDGDEEEAYDDDEAEADDLVAAQTAEVIKDLSAPKSPMGSHRGAAAQRGGWGKEWGIGNVR